MVRMVTAVLVMQLRHVTLFDLRLAFIEPKFKILQERCLGLGFGSFCRNLAEFRSERQSLFDLG